MSDRELLEAAKRWLDADPDPDTRQELQTLIAGDDLPGLHERFDQRLAFGTAGLRGLLGAGPARMNQLLVAQTTAGLCDHLRHTLGDEARQRGLCIGYDGRRKSLELAEQTASTAIARGFVVHRFDQMVPTPLLAFAVTELKAAAGVMVTASHNPAAYNGFKVYWHNGAQIIPPHDASIADAIARAADGWKLQATDATDAKMVAPEVRQRYLSGACEALGRADGKLVIAYTALHGVGESLLRELFAAASDGELHSVPEQAEPNMEFPTVAFPNPEEPGAMDRVLALAERVQADLVLANDPDADRLSVAAPNLVGEQQTFTGNDIGILLADYVLSRDADPTTASVLSSIVSTPLIERVARAYGAHHEVTLTGFKWICQRAMELQKGRGLRFVFGFEEALGYSVGTHVRDKDGITSALVMAQLAAELKEQGRTLWDRLHVLWRRHGLFVSGQLTVTLPGRDGAKRIAQCMEQARQSPAASVDGLAVQSVRDLLADPDLPPTDALIWQLSGGHRVAIRPSGTEPKLKVYVDVCQTLEASDSIEQGVGLANNTLGRLKLAMQAELGLDEA